VIARLIGRTGSTAGKDYVVNDAARVGASPDSEIRIVAQGVSRRHARIWSEKDQFFIEDLGATNGTFLNGGRIQRETLRHLDVITLGREVDLIFLRKDDEPDIPVVDRIQQARLQIVDGPEAGTSVDVPKGELTFGRAPSCNVVLASGAISKVHARLQRTTSQLVLQDLQSANGTFVNGTRVDSVAVVKNGDVISFAGVRSLSVVIEGDADPTPKTDLPAVIPGPAFDQEWKTRFVWAPDELAAIEAARAEAIALAALRAPAAVVKAGASPAAKAPALAAPVKPGAPVPAKPEPAAAARPAPPPAAKPATAPAPAPKPAPAAKAPEPPAAAPPRAAPPPAAQPASPVAAPPTPPAAAKPPAPAPSMPASPAAEKPVAPAAPAPAPAAPPRAAPPAGPPVAAPPAAPPVAAPPRPAAPPPVRPAAPTAAPGPPSEATMVPGTEKQVPGVSAKAAQGIRGLTLVGPGGPFALGLGTFSIGRAPGSNIRLDDQQASRAHARITITDASAIVEDLQTVNGTLVNGQEVKASHPLRHGDTVQFGSSLFKVELITS